MQNLNTRLASYMDKVVSLERANLKLEQQIKEFYESKSSISRKDLSKYYVIMEDLQKQIISRAAEKQQVLLQLDNASLAASDFNIKFETERSMRLNVEADLTRLRAFLENAEVATKNLEIQILGLNEELQFLKKSHEEELHMVRSQKSDSVDVQVDCGPAVNLDKELEEMREQYEALILKNRKQVEQWFQSKVKTLNTEALQSHTEITTSQKAHSDLKKTYQSLEIEINGFHTQIQSLQKDVVQVSARYSEQLSHLQVYIDRLQTEVQQITANMQQQAMEYQQLLDIKMRLELEIQEYRRLLEGELHEYRIQEIDTSKTTTVTETVVVETQEKEEEKHLHQKRVKIIMEELVDGVVVSTSVDEKVEDLSS
ncbi:hypothetical protein KOW79_009310 [Hemibagrus wyckioides]|uniref:IF rod domain-containing protein n=2 Tax=Hemibagrus wyckioides TaxID=337641 RepID=A0A9D3NSZ1_9TELE|nr:hypothetical protein KOW79_009310 [Hemibagrus wyckioides]